MSLSETVKVRKGNISLTVPAIDKEGYLAKGFDIIQTDGTGIKESISNDVPTLQAKVMELKKQNKSLKEEINALKDKKSVTTQTVDKGSETTTKKSTKKKSVAVQEDK